MADPSGYKYRKHKTDGSLDTVATRKRPDPSTISTPPPGYVDPNTVTTSNVPHSSTSSISHNPSTSSSPYLHPLPPPPYTLKDGETINCKNTLHTNSIIVGSPTTPQRVALFMDGRLPNGQLIDRKTCAQSFHEPHILDRWTTSKYPNQGIATTNHNNADVVATVVTVVDGGTTGTTEPPWNITNTTTTTTVPHTTTHNTVPNDHLATNIVEEDPVIHAVVVQDDQSMYVMDVEIPRPKRTTSYRVVIVLLAMILVAVVIWVAVDGGNEDDITTRPVMAPVSIVMMPSSLTPSRLSPNDGRWDMICDFLSISNVTECQSTTFIRPTYSVATIGTTIPTDIGLMTQVTHLDLSVMGLTGTIPTEIGLLTQLTYLDLSVNQFVGTLPSHIGNLIHLISLDLYENQLTNTIPSEYGNLLQLTSLRLENNQLMGTIPSSLGQLTRLNHLSCYDNSQLTGIIPLTLCTITDIGIYIDCDNIFCSCCNGTSCF